MNSNSSVEQSSPLIPFLKWAGGKRWLVDGHADLLPREYSRYIEPFLGGGSVFFHMQPSNAVLADANTRLIETYSEIRDNWERVLSALRRHHGKHCKDYYYEERARKRTAPAERAAQFIYLNRTCWNGLYRVNLKGKFNVPIGTKTAVVLETDDFSALSTALKNAKIVVQDFEDTFSGVGEGDFIYVDPPYTVNHKHNGFLKYNEKIFNWKDQVRLRDCVVEAIARGAMVAVSNADHESIRELYSGIGSMNELSRSSVIAGSAAKRGSVDELFVVSCPD